MKYAVRLVCKEDDGTVLQAKVSGHKWDTRDAAQLYGIYSLRKILVTENHLEYYVTDFELHEEPSPTSTRS